MNITFQLDDSDLKDGRIIDSKKISPDDISDEKIWLIKETLRHVLSIGFTFEVELLKGGRIYRLPEKFLGGYPNRKPKT